MQPSSLLELSLDELFSEIGSEITDKNALSEPFSKLVEKGREWFESNKTNIQSLICKTELLNEFKKETDNSKLIVIIADILSAQFWQIPVFSLAAIILKMGLSKICLTE